MYLQEARLTCKKEVLHAVFLHGFHLFALWRLAIFMVLGHEFGILHGPSNKVLGQCEQVLLQILWGLQVGIHLDPLGTTRQGNTGKHIYQYNYNGEEWGVQTSLNPFALQLLMQNACVISCTAFARDDCIKSCVKL